MLFLVPPKTRRSAGMYGLVAIILLGIGGWLARELWLERVRTLDLAALQAEHLSQIMSRSFDATFLATDYVLRDILGHVDASGDVKAPTQMTALLQQKRTTVNDVLDLAVLNKDCVYRATAVHHAFVGKRSNQRFCGAAQHPAGETLYLQYMPAEQSLSGEPVVIMARVLASSQGQMQATATAVIPLNYAQQWINGFDTLDDDALTLVDEGGIVLARKPHLASAIGRRLPPSVVRSRVAESEGSISFVATSPIDQRTRVYGLSRLERVPLLVRVGISEERTLRNWRHRIAQFVSGYALLVALALWLARSHAQLLVQHEEMERLASTDALTGIANRRQFLAVAEKETQRANRCQRPFSVVMLDIDHFKRINDQWGHPTGDRAICAVASAMTQTARSTDCMARIGGEEFVLLLPETKADGAAVMAERLRALVESSADVRSHDGTVVRYTVSIGVTTREEGQAQFDPVLQRADQALYQAKIQGRNRVVAA